MEEQFWFTLFDRTGFVEMETMEHYYTYTLDGVLVGKAAKCASFSPGKALNFIKKHTTHVHKVAKEITTMAPTNAGKHVRRERAVQEISAFMAEHGNFSLFRNGKALRVFPAGHNKDCEFKNSRLTGILFYKWVKRNARYKKFDRLILHVVCYRCRKKSPMLVLDPVDYDPNTEGFTVMDRFLDTHKLKHWHFKAK